MIPEFATPDKKDAFTYLKELCYEGLKLNFPEASDEINKRLEYELSVIKETDFADYFLVVWDIFQFVNNKKNSDYSKRKRNCKFGIILLRNN